MSAEWKKFSEVSRDAMLEMIFGYQIGSGAYRKVFELVDDDTLVAKVEYFGKEFCNIAEMQVWRQVQHTPIEDWFAPCTKIDSLGLVLFQKRTKGFLSEKEFKAALLATRGSVTIPAFFDDVHYGNFGMLEGRVVCHDYGFNHFVKQGVETCWRKIAEEDGQYALAI